MSVPVPLVIAGKDLRQRFRDRSAIVVGFVAPLAIAALMSFAFRGADEFHVTLGLVDGDHAAMSTAFADVLSSPGLRSVATVRRFRSEAAARAAVDGNRVAAAFVVPPGFTAGAQAASPEPITVLTSVDQSLGGQVARSIATSFVSQVNADRLSVATALAAGAPSGAIAGIVGRAGQLRLPVALVQRASGDRALKAISYYAPGMGIFFLLFAIGFTSRSWFLEDRQGTLERIGSATRPGQVLLGKVLAAFVYGSASLATMAVFTIAIFGADWGGPPGYAIGVAMVLAVVSLTALVISLARSERQAEGISSILTFGLALLGGNFVFVSASPPIMRTLALATPNGWALRGFVDLTTGPQTWRAAAGPLLAIVAFTAVVGTAASLAMRRRGATA
jgi:ABC-2 type transport system permease protein